MYNLRTRSNWQGSDIFLGFILSHQINLQRSVLVSLRKLTDTGIFKGCVWGVCVGGGGGRESVPLPPSPDTCMDVWMSDW